MATKRKLETETPEDANSTPAMEATPETEETVVEETAPVEENKALNLSAITDEEDDYAYGKVIGVVKDCHLLNVRVEPNTDAEVVSIIKEGDEVTVFTEESTDEFFKINTLAGVEGYSKCSYISLK